MKEIVTTVFYELSIVFPRFFSPLSFRVRRRSFCPPPHTQEKVAQTPTRARVNLGAEIQIT